MKHILNNLGSKHSLVMKFVPVSSVIEVEISPAELFQDIGSVIVEGRIPQRNKHGRKYGYHYWPVINKTDRKCCTQQPKNDLCQLLSVARSNISAFFQKEREYVLDVFCSSEEMPADVPETFRVEFSNRPKDDMVLLEQWKIGITEKGLCSDLTSVNMLLQAIRSYLHFSQLSSWWSSTGGVFPAAICYSLSIKQPNGDFLVLPEHHKFPCSQLSKTEYLQVSVVSLPRMDKCEFQELIMKYRRRQTYDGGGGLSMLSASIDKLQQNELGHTENSQGIKRKDRDLDEYFSRHLRPSNCQQGSYVGEKMIKYSNENMQGNSRINERTNNNRTAEMKSSNTDVQINNAKNLEMSSIIGRSSIVNSKIDIYRLENNRSNESSFQKKAAVPRISSTQSYMSDLIQSDQKRQEKSVSLRKYEKQDSMETKSGLSDLLQDFSIDPDSELNGPQHSQDSKTSDFEEDKVTPPRLSLSQQPFIRNTQPCPRARSKSTSPYFGLRQQLAQQRHQPPNLIAKPMAARKLALVAGTVPVFHPKTGLPISSSPAPIKKTAINTNEGILIENSLSRSGSSEELIPMGLSKSAPASTSLLGNFEESVLHGRMPLNGTLEGFRAELSASGTFCTKHVTLPVRVEHFNMSSESNAPSPYLGHIYFTDRKMKRKRFRVPSKGTVQLTLFNPNKTVIKVFIILYDFQDMPPLTKTFLRHKVVSVRVDPVTQEEVQTLHYLVHLSFVASKHSHIYLHTQIRLIFPQQTPDGKLQTITEGPTDPKYTSISNYNRFDLVESSSYIEI